MELTPDLLTRRLEVTMDRFPRMVLREYQLPGAVLGVFQGGRETFVPALPPAWAGDGDPGADRVFPLFSATKLLTATLVMRLVDQGLVQLDAPVADHVAEFRLPDPAVTAMITVRRLLAHTSGLRSGDLDELEPSPRPDERLADYVARSQRLQSVLPPGKIYSYSSTAYAVLGRLVETVLDKPWVEALGEDLLRPLGMANTVPHARAGPPELLQALGGAGEMPNFCDGPEWLMPVDQALSTPRDLLAFARLHLDHRDPSLSHLLRDDAVRAMRKPHVSIPDPTVGYAGGLGWRLYSTEVDLVGHWGVGFGHTLALWLLPAQDIAVVLVVFHPEAETMVFDVAGRLFHRLLAQHPRLRVRDSVVRDTAGVVGEYRVPGFLFRVEQDHDQLVMTCEQLTPRSVVFSRLAAMVLPMQPTDSAGDFLIRAHGDRIIVRFRQPDREGKYTYLHLWSQAAVRVR